MLPRGNKQSSLRGFTLIELLIVIAVIATLAVLTVPNLLESRIAANETSAIESLRIIAKGMETYRIAAKGGTDPYPADYRDLGNSLLPELDPVLATGVKSGYGFEGGGAGQTYEIRAVPLAFNLSGRRSFYINSSGVIRYSEANGSPAGPADPPLQ